MERHVETRTVDQRLYEYTDKIKDAPIVELLILMLAIQQEFDKRGY